LQRVGAQLRGLRQHVLREGPPEPAAGGGEQLRLRLHPLLQGRVQKVPAPGREALLQLTEEEKIVMFPLVIVLPIIPYCSIIVVCII